MTFLNFCLSLISLIILEIVLSIDNLVFLSVLINKLPKEQRKIARYWGLTLAWTTRLGLLFLAIYLVKLTTPIINMFGFLFSLRDLFFLIGGCFLIAKATQEIHYEVEKTVPESENQSSKKIGFKKLVLQVAIMDVIFSLDSVMAAIGLTTNFWVMSCAISCAIFIMLYASEPVSRFIETKPTIKMLALSFLILIGMLLVADGFSFHVPRAYVYFAFGFSLTVEMLNLLKYARVSKK